MVNTGRKRIIISSHCNANKWKTSVFSSSNVNIKDLCLLLL